MSEFHWRTRGLCIPMPELFFVHGNTVLVEKAKKICERCPVLADCETWVADARPEFGVVAAMTPKERKAKFGPPINVFRPPPKPKIRWCRHCGHQFDPPQDKPRAGLCTPCGRIYPDPRTRAYYAEVAAS